MSLALSEFLAKTMDRTRDMLKWEQAAMSFCRRFVRQIERLQEVGRALSSYNPFPAWAFVTTLDQYIPFNVHMYSSSKSVVETGFIYKHTERFRGSQNLWPYLLYLNVTEIF